MLNRSNKRRLQKMNDSKVSRRGITSWFKSNKKHKASSRFSNGNRRQSVGSSHRVRFESVNSVPETSANNGNQSHLFRKDTPEKETPTKLSKSKNLFLSFRSSTRKTKPKKNEVLKELMSQFDRSDFEFKFDDAGDPQKMNLFIEDTVEESKQELVRKKEEADDGRGNIRDTYMTTATDAMETSTVYSKHLSLDSRPQIKFSTLSISTETPKPSMTSLPVGKPAPKGSFSSDADVVQSI